MGGVVTLAHMSSSSDEVSLLAAVVGRQSLDLNVYAGFLLDALGDGLPSELVSVQRKSGLFGRAKPDAPILCVTVTFGDRRFVLQRPDPTRAPQASVQHAVAGIVLKTEPMPLDEWSQQVAAALAELAATNAKTAEALAKITDLDV
jgi:hypothetical protein